MSPSQRRIQRRWRDYRSASGRSPVKDFIMGLPLEDRAAVAAATKDVRIHGNSVAHHLRGEIYEVIARAGKRQYRVLYATEGRSDQILLAVHVIVKKTPSVPVRDITLAERRLRKWRLRGKAP